MTAVVVLAGGRSRRFGADKLAASLGDGRSILVHSLGAAVEVADELVVVVAPGSARPAGLPRSALVVHDPEAFGGPLLALVAGLGAATDEIVLVLGGDMPDADPRVLRLLAARLAGDPGLEAARLEVPAELGQPGPESARRRGPPGGVAPLPCAVRRGAAQRACEVALADGDRRLRGCLERLETTVIPAGEWRALDPTGRTLVDVDDPADLARLT